MKFSDLRVFFIFSITICYNICNILLQTKAISKRINMFERKSWFPLSILVIPILMSILQIIWPSWKFRLQKQNNFLKSQPKRTYWKPCTSWNSKIKSIILIRKRKQWIWIYLLKARNMRIGFLKYAKQKICPLYIG